MAFKGVPNPAKSSPHTKATSNIGSGKNTSGKQGYSDFDHDADDMKKQIGVAKSSVGSGSKAIDPMTREALRNVGC